MPRKKAALPASIDDLDALLDDLVSSGWDDPGPAPDPGPKFSANAGPVHGDGPIDRMIDSAPLPTYPPLPKKDVYYEPPVTPGGQALAVAVAEAEDEDVNEDGPGRVLDVGLLSDIASGRKTAQEAADAAGVTREDIQSQLATALHEMDPKEIAKAMGIQAAEQQLKSGALYGALLAELLQDVISGRMKPETKLEFAKLLGKNGGIEPKESKTSLAAGGGFVLNINMGAAQPQPITITTD